MHHAAVVEHLTQLSLDAGSISLSKCCQIKFTSSHYRVLPPLMEVLEHPIPQLGWLGSFLLSFFTWCCTILLLALHSGNRFPTKRSISHQIIDKVPKLTHSFSIPDFSMISYHHLLIHFDFQEVQIIMCILPLCPFMCRKRFHLVKR